MADDIEEQIKRLKGSPRTLAARTEAPPPAPRDLRIVGSAAERRCPFLKISVLRDGEDPEDEESYDTVDNECDVRTQTFDTVGTFGPLNIDICKICIPAKAFQLQQDQVEALNEAAEQAADVPEEGAPEGG